MNEQDEEMFKRKDTDIAMEIEYNRNELLKSLKHNVLFMFGWALFYLFGLLCYVTDDWIGAVYISWAISGIMWILLTATVLDSFEYYEDFKKYSLELKNFKHEKGDYGQDEQGFGE